METNVWTCGGDIHDAARYTTVDRRKGRHFYQIIMDDIEGGGTMIDEKITVNKIDNHYHIQIGCQETIVHDKKEALKWLGKLWDEHIKEE